MSKLDIRVNVVLCVESMSCVCVCAAFELDPGRLTNLVCSVRGLLIT